MDASTPMITTTMSNSISVNPERFILIPREGWNGGGVENKVA